MKKFSILTRIFGYTKKYYFFLALSLILAAITVAMSLYIPVLAGRAIDNALGKGQVEIDAIVSLLFKIGVIVCIVATLQWIMNICNNKLAFGVVRDIRKSAFYKLQSLPLNYLDSHLHGDTLSRIIADAEQLSDGLLLGFTQLFVSTLTILITLFFMLSINVTVALCVVLITPVSLLAARYIAKRTHAMFILQSQLRAEQTAYFNETVNNQKTVIAYGAQNRCNEKFNDINQKLSQHTKKAIFYSSLTNPVTRFVNSFVYVAVAFAGALVAVSNPVAMSAGMLTCLLSYAGQYTKPFNEISGVVAELQNAFACAKRLFELLDEIPEVSDENCGELKSPVCGNVELCKVDFSYVPQKPVIKGISLFVKSGQRVALVGHTGCGKTTLVNLLMRFYDVDSGKITVEGRDIKELKRHSLRENIGLVLQETFILHATVRDNIKLGVPNATDEEVEQAARLAHAHSFIKRLPKGYDTFIGEDGRGLSAGQRQLLCIARVFLKRPPLLILDEATSAVDTRTEMKIKQAFDKLMEGRTSFVVAHRLSTIVSSDIILYMRDGEIIEHGTHAELLSQKGLYFDLYYSKLSIT